MADRLRVGVVGVGHLGRHHARLFAEMPEAELVAIADIDAERARAVSEATGVRTVSDYRDLFDQVDAVSIAVPTDLHRDIGLAFLERGTSVLVEKPMARSVAEADELIAAASATGATLLVGHTERYNPAVAAVWPLVSSPRFIEVHRLGSFPDRSLDIDVVFDLMIHDLDIILAMVKSEVASFEAVPAADHDYAEYVQPERDMADTAMLLRELSSLGLEEEDAAPPPVLRPAPARSGGNSAAKPPDKKRKGLFGR